MSFTASTTGLSKRVEADGLVSDQVFLVSGVEVTQDGGQRLDLLAGATDYELSIPNVTELKHISITSSQPITIRCYNSIDVLLVTMPNTTLFVVVGGTVQRVLIDVPGLVDAQVQFYIAA